MEQNLLELIKDYYDKRGYKWPNFSDAMKFVHTELAEVYELDLARVGGFVRNNPQNKPTFSKERLAEELGDAIFMLLVAGIVEGVDPIESLKAKMERKLLENSKKVITGKSQLILLENLESPYPMGYGVAEWWLEQFKEDDKDGNKSE